MKTKIYLVPGPVQVSEKISSIYQKIFGSPDLDPDFFELYNATEKLWQNILKTKSNIAIMSGEAMLGLWSGLKSCLKQGDRVLAISNGLFGDGIAEMAKSVGAKVEVVKFDYNDAVADVSRIENAIKSFQPKMITAVHCETPSGILNPIADIGKLKKKYGIPLFYVDAVASIAGVPVNVDEWNIDICLGGGQKAPSIFADITFIAVSDIAWEIIEEIDYVGYDALKPFHYALQNNYFPYTPHWQGVAALHESAKLLLEEGLNNVFARHEKVATYCRERCLKMNLELYPQNINYAAPTVTAIKVPAGRSWQDLDKTLRKENVWLGGNYGELANKVFRIGHMGVQADFTLVKNCLDVLQNVLDNHN